MYNREDHFQEYVTHGPVGAHSYTPDSRMAIFKWINSHLKRDDGPVTDVDDERFPEEDLRTFPTDADIPKEFSTTRLTRPLFRRQRCAFLRAASSTRGGKNLSPGCGRCRSAHSRNGFLPADKAPRPNRYRFVEWERERRRAGLENRVGHVDYIALHGVVSNEPPRERPVTLVVLNEGESLRSFRSGQRR